jgi:hypothetical protein
MTKFCFFNLKDILKIKFNQINEMNKEILLHSPDNNMFLISWNNTIPTFIDDFEYEYLILDYREALEYMDNNKWEVFN